jgi:hypothetical protein
MDAQDIPKEWWTYHHSHCGTIYRGCHPTLCPKNVYEHTGKWIGGEKMKDRSDIHDVFLKQLVKNHPVSEETRKDLKGKSVFGKAYENGDIVLWFMLQTIGEESEHDDLPFESPLCDKNSIYTEPSVTFDMCSVTKNELDKFDEEYVLIRMGSETIPVFELKKEAEEIV